MNADQESGYHSAQSVCESFDMRGLGGDYPSQVAEDDTPKHRANKGGVDPTVKRDPTAVALLAEPAAAVRKGKEALEMPKELPTVKDAHQWLALTASALVEASAYDDRAKVAWSS